MEKLRKSRVDKKLAVILIFVCVILNSISQILLKIGSAKFSYDLISLITNVHLIIGFGLYAISAIILVIALKGGDLSTLYPILALGFVLVNILAWLILNENLNMMKWFGILTIMAGVALIGIGSKETSRGSTKCQ